MSVFNLKISMNNAAFEDFPAAELQSVLNQAVRKIKERMDFDGSDDAIKLMAQTGPVTLWDVNGNPVGEMRVRKT